jgi:hypothetical protein
MCRIIVSADALEIVEPFRQRQMRRDQMSGRRLLSSGNGVLILVLESKDARAKKLRVPLLFKTDATFDRWCESVPDLDAQEVKESEVELANTLYLYLPPEERARRIVRLRRIANGINIGSVALGFAGVVLPDPYHLLLAGLMLLPWVGVVLVARFQPLYRFGGPPQ